jgi:hypothetical protein
MGVQAASRNSSKRANCAAARLQATGKAVTRTSAISRGWEARRALFAT